MFINVSHQKLTEMSDDGPADTVVRDPFNDRFGLDVAQLLEGNLLQTLLRTE
jgi:hypothetical protein